MSSHPAYRPDPPASYIAKPRTCLMCRSIFDSSWQGERICPECRSSEHYESRLSQPDDFETIDRIDLTEYA